MAKGFGDSTFPRFLGNQPEVHIPSEGLAGLSAAGDPWALWFFPVKRAGGYGGETPRGRANSAVLLHSCPSPRHRLQMEGCKGAASQACGELGELPRIAAR